MHPLQVFLAGWAILLTAIAINALVARTAWMSWYGYLERVAAEGSLFVTSWHNLLFLYVLYPAALGVAAWLVLRIG